jgi:hypothetical protein
MGELVHEAFEVDGVLVEVDAAPEARWHRRVAHRVVDQEVRDRVADRRLRPARVQALEGDRVAPVLEVLGSDAGEIDWPGDAHVRPVEVARRVERAGACTA